MNTHEQEHAEPDKAQFVDETAKEKEKLKALNVLDNQIKWQWRWEKRNRHYYHGSLWIQWLCSLAITLLSVYQTQVINPSDHWIIFTIAILSTLSLTITGLSSQLKFQQRQQLHDEVARACDLISLKLEFNQITTDQAIELFEQLHRRPTEKVIRDMA